MDFWCYDSFEVVAETLGKLICIDTHTSYGTRLTDARFCTNIDVTQQLLNKIALKNEYGECFQTIQYDLLPTPCTVCKTFGHIGKDFPMKPTQPKPAPPKQGNRYMGRRNTEEWRVRGQ